MQLRGSGRSSGSGTWLTVPTSLNVKQVKFTKTVNNIIIYLNNSVCAVDTLYNVENTEFTVASTTYDAGGYVNVYLYF